VNGHHFVAARIRGASIRSTCPKPSRSAPTPSTNTNTRSPYAAPTESRLTAIAAKGTTIDRNASVSSTKLSPSTSAMTIGRLPLTIAK
jgi:hypothetical protein